MDTLRLYYPVSPLVVNQAFGIFNPAYEQFGFNKHNGVDYATDFRQPVYSMCDGVVVEAKDYPTGAGKAIRVRSLAPVTAEGVTEYVEFMYMHADERKVILGQQVKAGDLLTLADNTGFSTGTHLHISAYFVDPKKPIGAHKLPLGDKNADYCFDFSKYYNGLYAQNIAKPQVDPEIEKLVTSGIAAAQAASKYPSLKDSALKLLQGLKDFLSKQKS